MKNRLAAFFMQKKEVRCMGYARKDVEKTKKIAKKFVRYQEGAELYSIGLTKFQEIVEGRKTGINFLSYENHNVNVEE